MNMTSKAFRQSHLLKLIEECGTIEALAVKLGMNPQYLSQLKNGSRGIGDKTARKIELALGWSEGSLDRPPASGNSGDELDYLLSVMTEEDAVNAISKVLPTLSTEAVNKLTAAILLRINTPSKPE